MNKLVVRLFLIIVVVFALSACTKNDAEMSTSTDGDPPPAEIGDTSQDSDGDDHQDNAADTDMDDDHDEDAAADVDPEDDGASDTDEEDGDSESAPSAIDPAAVYKNNCARCHGEDRSGGRAPALLPDHLSGDAAQYSNVISNGRGGMPSWSGKLSAEEIDALAEWILTVPQ